MDPINRAHEAVKHALLRSFAFVLNCLKTMLPRIRICCCFCVGYCIVPIPQEKVKKPIESMSYSWGPRDHARRKAAASSRKSKAMFKRVDSSSSRLSCQQLWGRSCEGGSFKLRSWYLLCIELSSRAAMRFRHTKTATCCKKSSIKATGLLAHDA